jgi:hypothetical protein
MSASLHTRAKKRSAGASLEFWGFLGEQFLRMVIGIARPDGPAPVSHTHPLFDADDATVEATHDSAAAWMRTAESTTSEGRVVTADDAGAFSASCRVLAARIQQARVRALACPSRRSRLQT